MKINLLKVCFTLIVLVLGVASLPAQAQYYGGGYYGYNTTPANNLLTTPALSGSFGGGIQGALVANSFGGYTGSGLPTTLSLAPPNGSAASGSSLLLAASLSSPAYYGYGAFGNVLLAASLGYIVYSPNIGFLINGGTPTTSASPNP